MKAEKEAKLNEKSEKLLKSQGKSAFRNNDQIYKEKELVLEEKVREKNRQGVDMQKQRFELSEF